jgi:ribosomal protein S18 acetylase RimI-like enzyme
MQHPECRAASGDLFALILTVCYNLHIPSPGGQDSRMTLMVERASYVKRFKMEIDLRDLPAATSLPVGHAWVPWSNQLLDAHADVLFTSFRWEIDATVFPSFGDRAGCTCLMTEMSRKAGFLPMSTWLLAGPDGYVGSVQGLRDRVGVGAIQNLGVVPEARGRGLGTALLMQSLQGFRGAGLKCGMLEVTARNEAAVRLYRRFGFRCRKTVYKAVSPVESVFDGSCL